jgi:SAM-dependent methyltransferase
VSRALLERHRAVWSEKAVLRPIYRVWFDALLATVARGSRVLEVGAGPGFLSEYARERRPDLRWVASDLIETPWNDLVADGLRLPVRDSAVNAILALDLVHHLGRPADFFAEAARVLCPAGHVAVVEPWVTPLSYPIYRWLHQEGCHTGLDPWNPFAAAGDTKDAFQGDGALPWRIVTSASAAEWAEMGFHPPEVTVLNGFAYLLSLGFKRPSLLPRPFLPYLLALDAGAASRAPLFGLRALVVWHRRR